MSIKRILETALCAPDLDVAEAFHVSVLGLEVYARLPGRHVFFRCGDGMLLIFNAAITTNEQTEIAGVPLPLHGTSGQGHMAFAVDEAEIPAWRKRLESHGISIEADVAWPQGGRSIYFRDPAGNSIELATPKIWGMREI